MMSFKSNLNLRTLFVAHDVGGANLLVSLSKQFNAENFFMFSGPASKLLDHNERLLPDFEFSQNIHGIQQLITGTSLKSQLELDYLDIARRNQIPSISVLDNWSNYPERFVRDDKTTLPDTVWVCDKYALSIAQKVFEGTPVHQIPNYYVLEVLANISPIERNVSLAEARKLLYLCEPPGWKASNIMQDPNYLGYTEEGAINYFLINLAKVFPDCKRLTFRPHPSNSKFSLDLSKIQLSGVEIGVSNQNLASDISDSEVLIGTNSMALYIGILANRRAISAIPPNGYPCTIPDKRIIDLNSLLV